MLVNFCYQCWQDQRLMDKFVDILFKDLLILLWFSLTLSLFEVSNSFQQYVGRVPSCCVTNCLLNNWTNYWMSYTLILGVKALCFGQWIYWSTLLYLWVTLSSAKISFPTCSQQLQNINYKIEITRSKDCCILEMWKSSTYGCQQYNQRMRT